MNETNIITTEAGTAINPTLERVTNSPDDEWLARCARDGAPEPIGDDIVAALLLDSFTVTVRGDGIKITVGKDKLRFWQENSAMIHDAMLNGSFKEVPAKLDRDDPHCIHLFERSGQGIRYVETIDRYIAPDFMDKDACAAVLAAKKRQIRRLGEVLQFLHADDTRAAAAREVSNAEKIQRVHTFAVPSPAPAPSRPSGAAGVTTPSEDNDFAGGESPRHTLTDVPSNGRHSSPMSTALPAPSGQPSADATSLASSTRPSPAHPGLPGASARRGLGPVPFVAALTEGRRRSTQRQQTARVADAAFARREQDRQARRSARLAELYG